MKSAYDKKNKNKWVQPTSFNPSNIFGAPVVYQAMGWDTVIIMTTQSLPSELVSRVADPPLGDLAITGVSGLGSPQAQVRGASDQR